MDPIKTIKKMIANHGYENIIIKKGWEKGEHILHGYNDIPEILTDYVQENYNVTMCSSNYMTFYEFIPIGVETYFNEFMNN